MRRVFLYCMMIAAVLTACKNGMNEPNDTIIKDGKAKISLAAPSFNTIDGNQSASRKITGTLSNKSIVFAWDENDKVDFVFYNSENQNIGESSYIIQKKDIQTDKSVLIEIPVPEGIDHYDIAAGAAEFQESQAYKLNGISKNLMRFEKKGCGLLQEPIFLDPIWSVIIIQPDYTFTFDDGITAEYCTSYVGFDNITIEQTISSEKTTIVYHNGLDGSGNPKPITKSANEGSAPLTKYYIVIKPASECDLSITINYNTSLFTAKEKDETGETTIHNLIPSSDIKVVSMHTENQSVKNITKGNAYEIESIKSHPVSVHWVVKP